MKQQGDKHHYIPKFYLKQWAGPLGILCEFSRPHKTVKPRRTHYDGTGYERGLYTFERLHPEVADLLEKDFLLRADGGASDVLKRFLSGLCEVDEVQRSAWSRFIMTLLFRSPEAIKRLRGQIVREFPGPFATIQEYHSSVKLLDHSSASEDFDAEVHEIALQDVVHGALHTIMDSSLIGDVLNRMDWGVISINRGSFPLLTSDRPIVMSNGIGRDDSYLIFPISPRHAFIAAGSQPTARAFAKFDRDGKLGPLLNDRVAKQAYRYVWATDDTQLKFVEKRLGMKVRWSSWE